MKLLSKAKCCKKERITEKFPKASCYFQVENVDYNISFLAFQDCNFYRDILGSCKIDDKHYIFCSKPIWKPLNTMILDNYKSQYK